MRTLELVAIYLFVGALVAVAAGKRQPRWMAFALWPLVVPSLLTPGESRFDTSGRKGTKSLNADPIADAMGRLQQALDEWHPGPKVRLSRTETALYELDRRRAELAEILGRPENRVSASVPHVAAEEVHAQRLENLASLHALHSRLEGELASALARVEELVTRIQLAHFRGQPLRDVGEQLADLQVAVASLAAIEDELQPTPSIR